MCFSAGIRADGTDTALSLLMGDLEKYTRDGVTEAELAVLKRSNGQDQALKYEGLWDKASFMDQILRFNLPSNFIETQQRIMAGITKPEIDALAKKYIRPAQMNIVVVGDKATILRGLQKLPYEIVELGIDGRPVAAK
jgi:zinc protease